MDNKSSIALSNKLKFDEKTKIIFILFNYFYKFMFMKRLDIIYILIEEMIVNFPKKYCLFPHFLKILLHD